MVRAIWNGSSGKRAEPRARRGDMAYAGELGGLLQLIGLLDEYGPFARAGTDARLLASLLAEAQRPAELHEIYDYGLAALSPGRLRIAVLAATDTDWCG
ncbi:DUF6183 family protein [Streptomyces sp. NPDC006477]|uniref:DUF6183 family protein n=1 Tax=Streptomyces sp. NPDC006477 TaxID=3364747 RepID=UPI0036AF7253